MQNHALHTAHQIQTSRLSMHYLEMGTGEPLLLIHGWPQTSHCWHKVMPVLAKHFRVIAPDLRGFGESEHSGLPLLSRTTGCRHCVATRCTGD
ncbi:MAG: alpha/beta fold hydrolase [Cellvibrionales bacterium]|nr:alpha/beta fold hydrolase [Cellvibrionales bacterium]